MRKTVALLLCLLLLCTAPSLAEEAEVQAFLLEKAQAAVARMVTLGTDPAIASLYAGISSAGAEMARQLNGTPAQAWLVQVNVEALFALMGSEPPEMSPITKAFLQRSAPNALFRVMVGQQGADAERQQRPVLRQRRCLRRAG